MGRPSNSTPRSSSGGRKTASATERVAKIAELLAQQWPDAVVELNHTNAYQLLVATILSAQSTDKMINTVTPGLFAKYPDANALAHAEQGPLEKQIHSTGFFRNKARAIVGMARAVVERHGGEIPRTMDELVELPGVARKTANVVLGEAMGIQAGIVVDTHVTRLANRLGLTKQTDPVKIEQDLMALVPHDQWTKFGQRLIWHGRRVCFAKNPDCEHCVLAPVCPSAFAVAAPPKQAAKPTKKAPKSTPKSTSTKKKRK